MAGGKRFELRVRVMILLSCAVDAPSHVLETVQVWSSVAVDISPRTVLVASQTSLKVFF